MTNPTSHSKNEIDLNIPSDKINDNEFIAYLFVDTKLKILKSICDETHNNFDEMVKNLCKEVYKYPDLMNTYGIKKKNCY